MRKAHKEVKRDFEQDLMARISSGQITMKPRWYFVLGSVLSVVGLVGFGIIATFLTNLTIFLLRQHGPNSQWRLQYILDSFPLWVPVLAVVGTGLGIWMLKKYDFSYKKNFLFISLAIITAIALTAFLLNYTGLDNIWMKRGPMRRFYQQNTNSMDIPMVGFSKGQGRLHQIYKQ